MINETRVDPEGVITHAQTCPDCFGAGFITYDHPNDPSAVESCCESCDGAGVVEERGCDCSLCLQVYEDWARLAGRDIDA